MLLAPEIAQPQKHSSILLFFIHSRGRHRHAWHPNPNCWKPSVPSSISRSRRAASSIAPSPTCRSSGPSTPTAAASSGATTATRATPTSSWRWTPRISKTRSTPNRPRRNCCSRNWAASERNEHIAIGTATDPYQPAERRYARTRVDPGSLRARARAIPGHHHQDRPGAAGSGPVEADRARQRAGRQPHHHHAG